MPEPPLLPPVAAAAAPGGSERLLTTLGTLPMLSDEALCVAEMHERARGRTYCCCCCCCYYCLLSPFLSPLFRASSLAPAAARSRATRASRRYEMQKTPPMQSASPGSSSSTPGQQSSSYASAAPVHAETREEAPLAARPAGLFGGWGWGAPYTPPTEKKQK